MLSARKISPDHVAMAIIVVLLIICSIAVPKFLTIDNIMQVLRQMSVPAIIAVGVTFVVVAGRLDLSVGALLSCCAVAAVVFHNAYGPGMAILVALLIGIGVGCINGFLVAFLGLNSLITTLGMLSILQGGTLVYTAGSNAQIADAANTWFSVIGRGEFAGVPAPVIIAVVIAFIFATLLAKTTFGRRVFAVGGNATASVYASINARATIFFAYVIAGTLTAVAAIVYSSRVAAARSDSGSGMELMVLSAVILGGTSLLGGTGSVVRSIIGVLIIGFVQNVLLLLGMPYYLQWIVTALVIVGAVWTDIATKRGKVWA